MLSEREVKQIERSLANSEQDTRDEIGFLLLHQGFADRFFPGTSVLHTRIRYSLFIPWLYQRAASERGRGADIDAAIRRLLIELAIRLKRLGKERYGVIGGDKLGQLTSQPPDRVYWTALRAWGLLLPEIDSRPEVLRRLRSKGTPILLDDDGGRLDDRTSDVFAGLPNAPKGWDDPLSPLTFEMSRTERDYIRQKLCLVMRPGEREPSLLARLVAARDSFEATSADLPPELDSQVDKAGQRYALGVARGAAALAAIGRAVYGALIEELMARDGVPRDETFHALLESHFAAFAEDAGRCDLDSAEQLLPALPAYVRAVLRETKAYIVEGKPEKFSSLLGCYRTSEVCRKGSGRARLLDTQRSAERRGEWEPDRHNRQPAPSILMALRPKMLLGLRTDALRKLEKVKIAFSSECLHYPDGWKTRRAISFGPFC